MPDQLSESAQLWKERMQQWRVSRKTLAQWSRDNNLVYSQCIYWKTRFIGSDQKAKNSPIPNGFLELSDEAPRKDAGICVEVGGHRIHLSTDFDQATLIRCIALFKGTTC